MSKPSVDEMRRSDPQRLVYLFIFAIKAFSASMAFAADQDALDDQMTRNIQLGALNDWCTAAHDMDYDKLREALEDQSRKALSMTSSKRELRSSYGRAKANFLLGHRNPVFFCEEMHRAKGRPGFEFLREIFRD
jgi:hypothetical protein